MGRHDGVDNYGRPKSEYRARLASMTDEELAQETGDKILLSAFVRNNPKADWHWQVDACYDEWVKRGQEEKYEEIWKRTAK